MRLVHLIVRHTTQDEKEGAKSYSSVFSNLQSSLQTCAHSKELSVSLELVFHAKDWARARIQSISQDQVASGLKSDPPIGEYLQGCTDELHSLEVFDLQLLPRLASSLLRAHESSDIFLGSLG